MKFSTKALSLIALAGAALVACDDIKENERFIELPAVEAQRVVLLEEFTGQKCVNCPDAHAIIEGLEDQYPENLISVSLHGGGDAFSYDENRVAFGLRNEESQAYCDSYNIYSLPAGVVNRTSGVQDRDQWAATIRAEMKKPAKLDLKVEAVRVADGEAKITVLASPHDNLKANLQIWVVESGIVAPQLSTSGTKRDYVHNNVFRASVNGHDGEAVALVTREDKTFEYTLPLKEKWNADNLSIVAFLYNEKDGVLQAAKSNLVADGD